MGLPSLNPFSGSARNGVWRGDELGAADAQVLGTGHAALDAQLPGGGWPIGAMTEILQATPEAHVWQLLLPVLSRAVEARGGPVVLIGAPCEPFGPSLAAAGLPAESLLWIKSAAGPLGRRTLAHQNMQGQPAAGPPQGGLRPLGGQRGHAVPNVGATSMGALLWSCEQALRCAEVAAVLAWLPHARVGELRRLQLAAAQHEGLLFVFRPDNVAQSASPARLRLQLVSAGSGRMDVHLLKRRGPPLADPLTLPARSERMTALLAASQWRRKRRAQQLGTELAPRTTGIAPVPIEALEDASTTAHNVVRLDLRRGEKTGGPSHAMDRVALVV